MELMINTIRFVIIAAALLIILYFWWRCCKATFRDLTRIWAATLRDQGTKRSNDRGGKDD